MADKNHNNIPDQYEHKYKPGQTVKVPTFFGVGSTPVKRAPEKATGSPLADTFRNLMNFGSTVFGNNHVGAGAGDQHYGTPVGEYERRNVTWRKAGKQVGNVRSNLNIENDHYGPLPEGAGPTPQPGPEAPGPMTWADYLAAASEMLGSQPGGGGVDFGPQRDMLRQNASEADSKLEAMYRQLRGSIDADAPAIQGNYKQAMDDTSANTATAQSQTQQATDSANAQNDMVLANLGIQQAQGNHIQQGVDLNTQTAQRIADQATKGQAASDQLVSNKATALTHNTNIGNAAGLEGNLQRATVQAKLQSLLGELGMREQEQNVARQDNSFSQKLGLAQELIGFDRYNQERQDQQDLALSGLMNERDIAEIEAQGNQLPNMADFLASMGISKEMLIADPQKYAALLQAGPKYS